MKVRKVTQLFHCNTLGPLFALFVSFFQEHSNEVGDLINYKMTRFSERERLAKLALELAMLPVKPEYEDEELEKLVSFIMKMTTLYDLRDEDWTEEATKGIEDWLMEPRALILCIYFRGDKLKAASDIPMHPVYDLTYFVRPPDYIFRADTFHEEIVFGTFVDSIESNMIQMLELVYAPYFFAVNAWPDSEYNLLNVWQKNCI